jgi:hypothetical protein
MLPETDAQKLLVADGGARRRHRRQGTRLDGEPTGQYGSARRCTRGNRARRGTQGT